MEQLPFLERYKWIILIVTGIIVLGVFAFYLMDENDPVTIVIQPPPPTATHTPSPQPTDTPTPTPYEVYVTGEVLRPESLLSLPPGSRVEDAIEEAGGVTENADLGRVNLAQRLQDGDHIHVPAVGESDDALPTPNTPRLIDLNLATQAELESLPGIGPSTARAIIEYREANGGFSSVDDLLNVPGIGESTLERLRPFVMVDPLTAPTSAPTTTATSVPEASPTPGPLNLNTATQGELESLPGIGPSTARAIIEYRDQNGGFASVDDLLKVPGIGESTLERLRPFVMVDPLTAPTAAPTTTATSVPEASPTPGPLNLNDATQAELETLPRIGPATAQAIIEYREANGPFKTMEDILNVPGIGPATLEIIRDLVTVE